MNKNKYKISIIVPVYNSEKTLAKCIDSILNQTFQDFELILINDNSSDNSLKICEEYTKKDLRVKVINHEKNLGVSAARNSGLDIAIGEYIGFVDSDDYIEQKMYEILYKNITSDDNIDISVCNINNFDNKKENKINKKVILNSKICMKYLFSGKLLSLYIFNKLYKKKLFDNIRFPVGKIFEDTIITPQIFHCADKIVYNTQKLYNYVKNTESITHNINKSKYKNIIDSGKFVLKFSKKYYPEYINEAYYRYFWSYSYVFDNMIKSDLSNTDIDYLEVKNKLKENIIKITKNNNFSVKKRISLVIGLISRRLYKKILLMYN